MFVLVLPLLLSVALGAPQGYNYQLQAGAADNNELTEQQYRLLQQYAEQQLQQPLSYELKSQAINEPQQQQQTQGKLNAISKDATADTTNTQTTQSKSTKQNAENVGYQFADQLVQQAQQLVLYEQQQQQQKRQGQSSAEPEQETVTLQSASDRPAEAPTPANSAETTLAAIKPVYINSQLEATAADQAKLAQTAALVAIDPKSIVRQQTAAPAESLFEAAQLQLQQLQQQAAQHTPTHYNAFRIEPQSNSVQYNKEFFFHAAPQEEFDQAKQTQEQLNILKKNIRVVFIKAPEQNTIEKAALQLAKQAIDQQTAIYVLTKQHDVNDFAQKLQDLRAGTQAKPEVVFVKYKTPEEAEQAQRTIQAQYENLDGPNNYNHGATAATHNFASSLNINPRIGSGFKLPAQRPARPKTPASTYLPPLAKH